MHKKILLPIFALFNKYKLNKTAGPIAVQPSSFILLKEFNISFEDLFISVFIKFVFSFPNDTNFDSLTKSFPLTIIIFDKQSPFTSISLPNVTKPTFTFGVFLLKY